MSKLIWSESQQLMTLPEVMTLETIPKLAGLKKLLTQPVLTVDFSQVIQLDSAVLALLLTWSANVTENIKITNAPSELLTLIGLYDLESVLEIS